MSLEQTVGRPSVLMLRSPKADRSSAQRYTGKMNTETEASKRHFDAVSKLVHELEVQDIAVYQHAYDYLAFGSWEIVAGTRKRRVRVTWDGKDSRLTVEACVVPDSQSLLNWKQLESEPLESIGSGTEIILKHCAA